MPLLRNLRNFGGMKSTLLVRPNLKLFLIGALVGCYNIWMTIRTAPLAAEATPGTVLEPVGDFPEPAAARQAAE